MSLIYPISTTVSHSSSVVQVKQFGFSTEGQTKVKNPVPDCHCAKPSKPLPRCSSAHYVSRSRRAPSPRNLQSCPQSNHGKVTARYSTASALHSIWERPTGTAQRTGHLIFSRPDYPYSIVPITTTRANRSAKLFGQAFRITSAFPLPQTQTQTDRPTVHIQSSQVHCSPLHSPQSPSAVYNKSHDIDHTLSTTAFILSLSDDAVRRCRSSRATSSFQYTSVTSGSPIHSTRIWLATPCRCVLDRSKKAYFRYI